MVIIAIAYFRQDSPSRTAGFQDHGMFCFYLFGSQMQSKGADHTTGSWPFVSLGHARPFAPCYPMSHIYPLLHPLAAF